MSLEGAGMLVTGGTGALGRATVLALLARGARVAVPYRGEAAWQALREAAQPLDLRIVWGAFEQGELIAEGGPYLGLEQALQVREQ